MAEIPDRPDPDALLTSLRKEEAAARRGTLKVFLGMAPGVGKTYAMLEEARKLRAAGRDVAIGYVETHGRAETDALAAGLPAVPRRPVIYRGLPLTELDLDAVLARRPAVALVDELAHTNAPGSRHPKRYQDVAELLDAGIDVLSTLNVQHLESRAGTVGEITGAPIQETVPDSVLDGADVEIVDLSPEELLQRLDEGRVYVPERAAAAARNFFREGNLVALRELALHVAAEHAGQDVREYMQARFIAGPWKTGHRLLVAVSPSPHSEQMVRWTRRLADGLRCTWIAAHVETSRALSDEEQARLTRHLSLAKALGAEVRSTADDDIVQGLLRIARAQNATQIVVGKPGPGAGLPFWPSRTLLPRLVKESGSIDIHVIRAGPEKESAGAPFRLPRLAEWPSYVTALAFVGALTLFNLLLAPLIGVRSVALVYLVGVVALAMRLDRGPIYLAAALSALLWNMLFLPPVFTLYIRSLEDAMMFAVFFVIAVAMGQLIARIRARERMDRRREERASAMYLLTLELADATTLDQILRVSADNIERVFKAAATILLPGAGGVLEGDLAQKELATAQWAFDHAKAAGRFTDTLPMAEAMFLPLCGSGGVLGVLGLRWPSAAPPTIEQAAMLEAFQRHIALVLDRQRLREAEAEARIHAASERLQTALLDSVSHELKTPLAVISSAAEQMPEGPLVHEVRLATQRLIRVVDQLLDMTRLNSGLLRPRLEGCDVADLLHTTVRDLGDKLARHRIAVEAEGDLPPARLDFRLLQEALANLLRNAATYSPPDTEIRVSARADESELAITVADRGPGLKPGEPERVFEKFYRGAGAPPGGLGLGLSIAKRLVEAHEGRITAENRPGGGAVFSIRLPLRPVEVPGESP